MTKYQFFLTYVCFGKHAKVKCSYLINTTPNDTDISICPNQCTNKPTLVCGSLYQRTGETCDCQLTEIYKLMHYRLSQRMCICILLSSCFEQTVRNDRKCILRKVDSNTKEIIKPNNIFTHDISNIQLLLFVSGPFRNSVLWQL